MNEKHDCHHLLGSLSEYVDGTLQQELCAEIERHMSGCENCRIVVNTLRKTIELYQEEESSQTGELPAEVRRRLYYRLDLDKFEPPAKHA